MSRVQPARARRLLSTVVAVGAAVAVAACGTGSDAQTHDWYNAADGSNNSAEATLKGMAVRAVVVVSNGSDATVLGTFVNTGDEDDAVEEIVVDGETATISGTVTMKPGETVRIGPPGEARAEVSGGDIKPGSTVRVEISFERAAKAELTSIVRAAEGEFEDSGPGGGTSDDSESEAADEAAEEE